MKRTVGRALIRIAAFARGLVWAVLRPRTIGALVIVADGEGRVMLVNHSYETDVLRFPGGGAKRGEALHQCAARELREETGLRVDPEALELLGVYSGMESGQAAFIAVYVAPPGTWKGEPRPSIELDLIEFHSPERLPPATSPATRRRAREFAEGRRGLSGRWAS